MLGHCLPSAAAKQPLDWAPGAKGTTCRWEPAKSAGMAGSVEDPGSCGQGHGRKQLCLTSVTGNNLVWFMVCSAWHCSAPLEILHMLCSAFPRSHFLGNWESGCCKNVAKAMSLFFFHMVFSCVIWKTLCLTGYLAALALVYGSWELY